MTSQVNEFDQEWVTALNSGLSQYLDDTLNDIKHTYSKWMVVVFLCLAFCLVVFVISFVQLFCKRINILLFVVTVFIALTALFVILNALSGKSTVFVMCYKDGCGAKFNTNVCCSQSQYLLEIYNRIFAGGFEHQKRIFAAYQLNSVGAFSVENQAKAERVLCKTRECRIIQQNVFFAGFLAAIGLIIIPTTS